MVASNFASALACVLGYVREATSAAVRRAFGDIGLYADDPVERRKVREDFRHLRKWREVTDAMAIKVWNAVLLALVGRLLAALWLGIKSEFLKQI